LDLQEKIPSCRRAQKRGTGILRCISMGGESVGAAAVFMRSNLDGAATVAGLKTTTFPVWHGTGGSE
jgi:hypothetical protein